MKLLCQVLIISAHILESFKSHHFTVLCFIAVSKNKNVRRSAKENELTEKLHAPLFGPTAIN